MADILLNETESRQKVASGPIEYNKELKNLASEYASVIPEAEKTPEAEYKRRLEICSECSYLVDGLCVLCGCFVEIRAAKRSQSCANGYWLTM